MAESILGNILSFDSLFGPCSMPTVGVVFADLAGRLEKFAQLSTAVACGAKNPDGFKVKEGTAEEVMHGRGGILRTCSNGEETADRGDIGWSA
jgi:hypothetical protein